MLIVSRAIFFALLIFSCYAAFSPSDGSLKLPFIDKVFHFFLFFLLSMFLDLSSKSSIVNSKSLILFLVFYALLIEVVQSFLVYRSAEVNDFIFDLLGILVYLMFAPRIIKNE